LRYCPSDIDPGEATAQEHQGEAKLGSPYESHTETMLETPVASNWTFVLTNWLMG
jgi:hypothetical protein